MITGRQVRAARALLNWKQEMLAEKALVALTALKRLESERQLQVHEGTRDRRSAAEQVTSTLLGGLAKPALLVFDNLEHERLLRACSIAAFRNGSFAIQ